MSKAGVLLGGALVGSAGMNSYGSYAAGQSAHELQRANEAREGFLDKTALSKFVNDHFADVPKSKLQPIIDEVWDAHHATPGVFGRFILGHTTDVKPDDAERTRREVVERVKSELGASPT